MAVWKELRTIITSYATSTIGLVLFLTFSVGSLSDQAIAEPLSRISVNELFSMFNKGELTQSQVVGELEKWGIEFQLSKETVDELSSKLNSDKSRILVGLLRNQIAPLTFNGHGITILGKQEQDSSTDLYQYAYSPIHGFVAPKKFIVDQGFIARTSVGKQLQLNFFLQNSSSIHDIFYEHIYAEVLGVNYWIVQLGGGTEPTPSVVLPMFRLGNPETYIKKSNIELSRKDFLRSEWCMIAKNPEGKVKLAPGNRQPYQVSIAYFGPDDSPHWLCDMNLYIRFIVPYNFSDGIWRSCKSDKFYRILFSDEQLVVTEYSETEFFDLIVHREINGYVIKNSFDRKMVDQARFELEELVTQANAKLDVSKEAFQALRALDIIGSPHLVKLVEDYIRNFVKVYYEDPKKTSDPCFEGVIDDENRQACNCIIDYLQLPVPIADGKTCDVGINFWPDYLSISDPRAEAQHRWGDFEAHFAILFDILQKAKSPVIEDLRRKNYSIPVFNAYLGDKAQ